METLLRGGRIIAQRPRRAGTESTRRSPAWSEGSALRSGRAAVLSAERALQLLGLARFLPAAADARLADQARQVIVGAGKRLQQLLVDYLLEARRQAVVALEEPRERVLADFQQYRVLAGGRAHAVGRALDHGQYPAQPAGSEH